MNHLLMTYLTHEYNELLYCICTPMRALNTKTLVWTLQRRRAGQGGIGTGGRPVSLVPAGQGGSASTGRVGVFSKYLKGAVKKI